MIQLKLQVFRRTPYLCMMQTVVNVRVLWSDNANSSFLVFVHLRCFLRLEWSHFSRSESFTSLPHFWRCSRCYLLWKASSLRLCCFFLKVLVFMKWWFIWCCLYSDECFPPLSQLLTWSPWGKSASFTIFIKPLLVHLCIRSYLLCMFKELPVAIVFFSLSSLISSQQEPHNQYPSMLLYLSCKNKQNKQTNKTQSFLCIKFASRAFPGGPGVKNPPCIAKDTGSIPDPGRFHMWQGN